jgi:TolB protein
MQFASARFRDKPPRVLSPRQFVLALLCLSAGGASCDERPDRSAPTSTAHPSAGASTTKAPPTPKPLDAKGHILFVSERHGAKAVYTIDVATGATARLTARPFDDFPAAPSPRADHLLLVSAEDRAGGLHREQMWRLGSDGLPVKIGPASGMVRNPAWLPDGSAIIVESNKLGFRDLHRVPLDGGESTRLTAVKQGCFEPHVHPEGDRLAYVSSQEGNAEIFVRPLDEDTPRRLTWSPRDDTAPRWSPKGDRIAWLSARDGRPLVFVMQPDGGKPHALVTADDTVRGHEAPRWSPDGKRIAFTQRSADGGAEMLVAAADDGAIVFSSRGTLPPTTLDEMPSWSPDGRHLAFVSNRSGDTELHLARIEDRHVVRLTRSPEPDWLPRWLPAASGPLVAALRRHSTDKASDASTAPAAVSSSTSPDAAPSSSTRHPRVP